MKKNFYRLIYVSDNEIEGTNEFIQHEIKQILEVSRLKNKEAGITGALMFNKGCFAQVLEGPQNSIQTTFERIQCDTRHSNVVILNYEVIEKRRYENWSMAYVGDNESIAQEFFEIKEKSNFDPESLAGEKIYQLLKEHLISEEK